MRHLFHTHVSLGPGHPAPAGPELPPIPPVRRELHGVVYRGVRLLKPWWRHRLSLAAQLAALIIVVSVVGGLIAGHYLLRYIQQ